MSHVGQRVREARERAGVSQRELSRSIGASQSSISELEAGQACGMGIVSRVAEGLGVTSADLLLEGPPLLEVVFQCPELAVLGASAWMERRVLSWVPEGPRSRVAVWPYRDDGALRFRALASSVPALAAMTGTSIPGTDSVMPRPTVEPVRPSPALEVLIRAHDEGDARRKISIDLGCEADRVRIRIERAQDLWLAHVEAVSRPFSLKLQSIARRSPMGLFVPA